MKTTKKQKKTAKETRKRGSAQDVRGAIQRGARTRKAVADRQVAEFERTFTRGYEW
jgi:hypothetical protein